MPTNLLHGWGEVATFTGHVIRSPKVLGPGAKIQVEAALTNGFPKPYDFIVEQVISQEQAKVAAVATVRSDCFDSS